MDKIVAYCGTRNVYNSMEVAAKSFLFNTPVDRIYFMIEDDEFHSPLPDIIQTINVSEQTFFDRSGANYNNDWTYMAFLRLAFGKIFKQHDTILYLDVDTLVLQDVSDAFVSPDCDWVFKMVQEDINDITLETCKAFAGSDLGILPFISDSPRPEYPVHPYYNSGVMLMNLHKMRESGLDDVMIHELDTVKYPYPDQDIINKTCHDLILPLPTAYNVIPALFPDFPNEQIKIKHFASDKPLWKSSLWQSYRRLSWDEVMQKQNALKGVT